MPMRSARGRSRCGFFISPAIHVTQYHASLAQSTAIIATPNAASGAAIGRHDRRPLGRRCGGSSAMIGSAASPPPSRW
jgi:hypothetical protein